MTNKKSSNVDMKGFEKIRWTDRMKNEKMLNRVKKERTILVTLKR